jgi:hypothetical protein
MTQPEAQVEGFPIGNLLDAEVHLRRPFTPAAIKMKPQTTTGEGAEMKGLASFYIDARLVAARLNAVVGADAWSDRYDVLIRHPEAVKVGLPVQCTLTVHGVERTDVGQINPGEMDNKAWKSAYSDALKRTGVKFGIAAYLYGGPNVWAPVKVGRNGKAQGFSPEGIKQAKAAYARWIESEEMKRLFGLPFDHGDVDDGEPAAAGEPEPEADPAQPELRELPEGDKAATDEQVERVLAASRSHSQELGGKVEQMIEDHRALNVGSVISCGWLAKVGEHVSAQLLEAKRAREERDAVADAFDVPAAA